MSLSLMQWFVLLKFKWSDFLLKYHSLKILFWGTKNLLTKSCGLVLLVFFNEIKCDISDIDMIEPL